MAFPQPVLRAGPKLKFCFLKGEDPFSVVDWGSTWAGNWWGNQSWAQRTLLLHLFAAVITDRNIQIFKSSICLPPQQVERSKEGTCSEKDKRGRKKKKTREDKRFSKRDLQQTQERAGSWVPSDWKALILSEMAIRETICCLLFLSLSSAWTRDVDIWTRGEGAHRSENSSLGFYGRGQGVTRKAGSERWPRLDRAPWACLSEVRNQSKKQCF